MQIVRDAVSASARVQAEQHAEEKASAQEPAQPADDFQREVWAFGDMLNVGRDLRDALGSVS